jgi:RNA polymerase sigma-70 factor (ECF subfamily)
MSGFAKENHSLSTSPSLVAELQALSPERWDAFVRIYSPLLIFFIRKEQLPLSAHEEVLQEALRSIFSGIGSFRQSDQKGSFRGWLRTIVRRRTADFHRRNAKSVTVQDFLLAELTSPAETESTDLSEGQVVKEIVARACEVVRNTVQPQTWKMFELSVLESKSTKEIVEILGVKAANIRMAKARVLKQLRELLVDFS